MKRPLHNTPLPPPFARGRYYPLKARWIGTDLTTAIGFEIRGEPKRYFHIGSDRPLDPEIIRGIRQAVHSVMPGDEPRVEIELITEEPLDQYWD